MNAARPSLSGHPMYHPSAMTFMTPMAKRLSATLAAWLWSGASGGLVLGESRVGKSKAIRMLANTLKDRLGNPIPARIVIMPRRDKTTIASVFKNLCIELNVPLNTRATADAMSGQLVQLLAEAALQSPSMRVVLFVDEMQRLAPVQFSAFAELFDRLELLNLHACVVFVGNTAECGDLLEAINEPFNAHIRGRFFLQTHQLLGISNHDELKACLAEYDRCRYPEPAGPTYTQAFLPGPCQHGWKMADISRPIWSVYRSEFRNRCKLTSWPMHYFIAAANALLIDYLPRYGIEDERAVEQMIIYSIQASGLIPSIIQLEH